MTKKIFRKELMRAFDSHIELARLDIDDALDCYREAEGTDMSQLLQDLINRYKNLIFVRNRFVKGDNYSGHSLIMLEMVNFVLTWEQEDE